MAIVGPVNQTPQILAWPINIVKGRPLLTATLPNLFFIPFWLVRLQLFNIIQDRRCFLHVYLISNLFIYSKMNISWFSLWNITIDRDEWFVLFLCGIYWYTVSHAGAGIFKLNTSRLAGRQRLVQPSAGNSVISTVNTTPLQSLYFVTVMDLNNSPCNKSVFVISPLYSLF